MYSPIIIFLMKSCSKKKEETLGVTWGCCYFLFEKEDCKTFVQCHVFAQSPPGRRLNDKYPGNTAHRSDLCKNVSLAMLFGSNGNSYTTSTQICIYTGCPRRNVKYFGRVFLELNYTDITQNTYIQS